MTFIPFNFYADFLNCVCTVILTSVTVCAIMLISVTVCAAMLISITVYVYHDVDFSNYVCHVDFSNSLYILMLISVIVHVLRCLLQQHQTGPVILIKELYFSGRRKGILDIF